MILSPLLLNLLQMRAAIYFTLCKQRSSKRNKIFLTWNILLGAELDFCYTMSDYSHLRNIWGKEYMSSRASALGEWKKKWQPGDVCRHTQGIYLSGYRLSWSSSKKSMPFFFKLGKNGGECSTTRRFN